MRSIQIHRINNAILLLFGASISIFTTILQLIPRSTRNFVPRTLQLLILRRGQLKTSRSGSRRYLLGSHSLYRGPVRIISHLFLANFYGLVSPNTYIVLLSTGKVLYSSRISLSLGLGVLLGDCFRRFEIAICSITNLISSYTGITIIIHLESIIVRLGRVQLNRRDTLRFYSFVLRLTGVNLNLFLARLYLLESTGTHVISLIIRKAGDGLGSVLITIYRFYSSALELLIGGILNLVASGLLGLLLPCHLETLQ